MEKMNDLIDTLINDWERERPELDVSSMGIVGRILHLGKLLEKRASKVLRNNNIYYTDLDVLATLRRSGKPYELSPTQLRESVLITSGAMTALLDRLEKLQLLYRKTHPKDGRVKMAGLTPKGKTIIDNSIKVRFEEAASAVVVFNTNEKKEFSNLLKKMMHTLENDIGLEKEKFK